MKLYRQLLCILVLIVFLTACSNTTTPTVPIAVLTADPYSAEVISKISLDEPRGITKGSGSLWVNIFGDTLFRLDPSTGEKQATITDGIGKKPAEIFATDNALWMINSQ